jgi:hypothetical protein
MRPTVPRRVFEHALATGQEQEDARQVLEVRRGLEIAMAGQAALQRTPRDVVRLRDLGADMGGCLSHPEAFLSEDRRDNRRRADECSAIRPTACCEKADGYLTAPCVSPAMN